MRSCDLPFGGQKFYRVNLLSDSLCMLVCVQKFYRKEINFFSAVTIERHNHGVSDAYFPLHC